MVSLLSPGSNGDFLLDRLESYGHDDNTSVQIWGFLNWPLRFCQYWIESYFTEIGKSNVGTSIWWKNEIDSSTGWKVITTFVWGGDWGGDWGVAGSGLDVDKNSFGIKYYM